MDILRSWIQGSSDQKSSGWQRISKGSFSRSWAVKSWKSSSLDQRIQRERVYCHWKEKRTASNSLKIASQTIKKALPWLFLPKVPLIIYELFLSLLSLEIGLMDSLYSSIPLVTRRSTATVFDIPVSAQNSSSFWITDRKAIQYLKEHNYSDLP